MAGKTLSERIADQLNAKKETTRANNKAQFVSVKTDVEHALKDGWSVRQIYLTLNSEGQITFSYEAFRRKVKKYITAEKPVPKEGKNDSTPGKRDKGKSGFQFNSKADKEDLL